MKYYIEDICDQPGLEIYELYEECVKSKQIENPQNVVKLPDWLVPSLIQGRQLVSRIENAIRQIRHNQLSEKHTIEPTKIPSHGMNRDGSRDKDDPYYKNLPEEERNKYRYR